MRRIGSLATAALALAIGGAPVAAQEAAITPFAWDAGEATVLSLTGDIGPGAAAAFEAALAAHPEIEWVRLNGAGTSLPDALAIAQRVHDTGLGTEIRAGESCWRACAIVFLAGIERIASGVLSVTLLLPEGAGYAATQYAAADLIEALADFGYSDETIRAVIGTGPSGWFGFSPFELARYGIDTSMDDAPAGWDAEPYGALYEQPAQDAPPETPWLSFAATSTWTLAEDEAGAPELALEIAVPDRALVLDATFTASPGLRSLRIEVAVSTPNDFPGGAVADVFLFTPRPSQGAPGIGPGFYAAEPFVFQTEESDLDGLQIRQMLGQPWMAFILYYDNEQTAELLFEVGEQGRSVLDAAIAAWQ